MGIRHVCASFCFLLYFVPEVLRPAVSGQAPPLTNVALHKPSSMNSYHITFGRPEKAVDGNKKTGISQCVHTAAVDNDPEKWFRVDLQGLFQIYRVELTNRGDCCGDRLSNFDIITDRYISDSSKSRQDSSQLCVHRSSRVANGATVTLSCSKPVLGRFVTLVRPSTTQPLNFCEIEVMAAQVLMESSIFHRHSNKKTVADVMKTVQGKSVIGCAGACTEEPGCTAFNLQNMDAASGGKGRKLCQLVANQSAPLLTDTDWHFYRQESANFKTVLV